MVAPTRGQLDLTTTSTAFPGPEGSFDALIHCAASRERGLISPERLAIETNINVTATERLLNWARGAGVRRVIYVSTISVLKPSPNLDEMLDEQSVTVEPGAHPYAVTKLQAEKLVETQSPFFEGVSILRLGHVFGPGMSAARGWATALASARRSDGYLLAAPRGMRFCPVFIDDVVDVIARTLDNPPSELLHVVGPDAIDEQTLLADAAHLLGFSPQFCISDEPAVSMVCGIARVNAAFPGRVVTSWPSILEQTPW